MLPPLLLGALLAMAAVPGPGAASARGSCTAPNVVGVSLAQARRALGASGCAVTIRQLAGHGSYRPPSAPDPRQIVARQSPGAGASAGGVTVWLKPLCYQPAAPGPTSATPALAPGPTELVTGLFLSGGPLRSSTSCRRGSPSAGTVTVATAAGRVLTSRAVRAGRFAIFPLRPGRYEVSGTFAGGRAVGPVAVTIVAGRIRHRDLVAGIR